jgi:hypothetical protein
MKSLLEHVFLPIDFNVNEERKDWWVLWSKPILPRLRGKFQMHTQSIIWYVNGSSLFLDSNPFKLNHILILKYIYYFKEDMELRFNFFLVTELRFNCKHIFCQKKNCKHILIFNAIKSTFTYNFFENLS